LDSKFRRCVFIKYETDEYNYQFWDPEDHKILRHKDVIFNEQKMYKDLQTERSTLKNDLGVAPQSTPEQQSTGNLEFVELEDAPVDKARNILKGDVESQVEPPTPQTELRRSTRQTKAPERYSLSLHYLFLTESGDPECYEEALQVEAKAEWELAMDDEIASLMENQI